ncbi:hypothetical protein [Rubellicoccus peritrichatus]|uniref:TIGR03067 domain-containing protein n=1 Tax=Rubellicoccus peritrichatus TaxID=3080537 RepID=A0AAQ3LC27_9BACT|nr:hypothetical protein [Puniceicoccus sp. CR14]WOO42567.1 hypothetical protein RZN69_05650 [Puniceicoccus sp. CR14]
MKRNSFLLLITLLCFSIAADALPPGKRHAGRELMRVKELFGDWKSTNISGDGLWLVVSDIGLNLGEHGTFYATAMMNDGGKKIFKGDYYMDKGKIRLDLDEKGDFICYYTLKDDKLNLHFTKHDVRVQFERGKLEVKQKPASSVGAPGMHF